MKLRLLTGLLAFTTTGAFARAFDRPVPNPQSATAELWFALASLALVAALYVVHRLVNAR